MRLIKPNTVKYEAFHKTLPVIENNQLGRRDLHFLKINSSVNNSSSLNPFVKLEKFQEQISTLSSKINAEKLLKKYLNEELEIASAKVYLLDETKKNFIGNSGFEENIYKKAIQQLIVENKLDSVFDKSEIKIIANNENKPEKVFAFPIFSNKKRFGLLLFLSNNETIISEKNNSLLGVSLGLLVSCFERIKLNEELNDVLHELQIYQSKLSNDYKLSAIGELTSGIAEEILNPMQVILSQVDLLCDRDKDNNEILEVIKSQITKVNVVVNRIIKFASLNNEKFQINPCNINDFINDYYNVINSSYKYNNYEVILDLQENIPSVLSNPNYLNQLLSNVFSLIKTSGSNVGGIVIQTKYLNGNVVIRIMTTDKIELSTNGKIDANKNLAQRIIKNLIKKHEGEVMFESNGSGGSLIILSFPVKRKLRA